METKVISCDYNSICIETGDWTRTFYTNGTYLILDSTNYATPTTNKYRLNEDGLIEWQNGMGEWNLFTQEQSRQKAVSDLVSSWLSDRELLY